MPKNVPRSTDEEPRSDLRSSPLTLNLECIHIAAARFHQQILKLSAVSDSHFYLTNQFIGNIQRRLTSPQPSMQSISRVPLSASAYGTVGSDATVLAQTQGPACQRPEPLDLLQEPFPHLFGRFACHQCMCII